MNTFTIIVTILYVLLLLSIQTQSNLEDLDNLEQSLNQLQDQLSRRSVQNGLRLIGDRAEDKDKKVVAVIVTFSLQASYDTLFTKVEQKVMEGSKVEVYAADSLYLEELISAFQGLPKDDVAVSLMKSIKEVDADCVVLNWECSSGYSNEIFPQGAERLFYFLKMAINRGHMTMFSDFSLKALIYNWKDSYGLGPNPFVKISQYSGNFLLSFDSQQLKKSPSAQLQTVGDLTETGTCNVIAMGGTIVYTINKTQLNHRNYKLKVLTVVETLKPNDQSLICEIGRRQGAAGHVLLTYPSGGTILTSMGHWIELMKIDTSAKKLFEVAQKEFGKEKARQMENQYLTLEEQQQGQYLLRNSVYMVQNQAPSGNMIRKERNNKVSSKQ